MRMFALLLIAASPALAGPPEFAHYSWFDLARVDDATWIIGAANCDEAGMRPAAVRIDTGAIELDPTKVSDLAKHSVKGERWGAGDDVYEPGSPARLSHDHGKTWRKLADLAVFAGAGDDVYAVTPLWRVTRTHDHGKTWTDVEVTRAPYRCLGR